MSGLITGSNLDDPDGLYATLMEAHRGLSDAESRRLDAKLVLLLANHIGDMDVIRAAIAAASGRGEGRVV